METTPTSESGESPGPAPISEPIHDSALRGDKHMVDAYPPPKER